MKLPLPAIGAERVSVLKLPSVDIFVTVNEPKLFGSCVFVINISLFKSVFIIGVIFFYYKKK